MHPPERRSLIDSPYWRGLLNRDILWQLLDQRGVKPVRQVSIDDVWSALRFRAK